MYFAHITPALVAKTVVPRVSLGILLLASMAIDVLSGVLAAVGIERFGADGVFYYPWSHGLLMSAVISVVLFLAVLLICRCARSAAAISLVYFSHWVLDFVSHPMGFGTPMEPDLPLAFANSPRVGLGIYNHVAPALIVELTLFAAGITLYLLRSRAVDRTGRWVFWAVPVFLLVLVVPMTILPDAAFIPTILSFLLLPLGIWVDRHREVRTLGRPG
jgi:hypothetical protein